MDRISAKIRRRSYVVVWLSSLKHYPVNHYKVMVTNDLGLRSFKPVVVKVSIRTKGAKCKLPW